MRSTVAIVAGGLVIGLAAAAWGQNNAPTTVQLPTFSFFTVSTTVSVPDGGGAYLGGVSRGRVGSTSRGLPMWSKSPWLSPLGRSRGIGSDMSTGGVSVHATIIDHSELDEALLAEAAGLRGEESPTAAKARHIGRYVLRDAGSDSAANPPANSVAAIRRQQAEEEQQQADEVSSLLAKAEAMEQAKKPGQARIYYQMALRRAGDDLKQQIQARIAALAR